mmetsp:Transcript_34219/g.81574  ORF Transcript_34219/g.81574 Transcript_34219/m.81574 type:complete len:561 (-) Transcript_34219:3549-5231(-)
MFHCLLESRRAAPSPLLVVELGEEGDAAADPVLRRELAARELEVAHVVGGVACGRQSAGPRRDLVQRAVVRAGRLGHHPALLHHRVQPDHRHVHVRLAKVTLRQTLLPRVPPPALHVEPVDVDALRRLPVDLVRGRARDLGAKVEGVDGDALLARERLQRRRHVALREEEGRHPEALGRALHDPLLHEVDALQEVLEPGAERLEREVPDVGPEGGHALEEERLVHTVELRAHHDEPLDRALQLRQRAPDLLEHLVELAHLDGEEGAERVDGAFVVGAEGGGGGVLGGEQARHPVAQLQRQLRHHLVRALSAPRAPRARLHRDDGVHQVLGLAVLERDRRVPVQPEHLRRVDHRQLVHVLPHARQVLGLRGVVLAVLREGVVVGLDRRGREVLGEDGGDAALVHVVGDAPAVVDVAHHVAERLVRHLVLLLEVHAQVRLGCENVRLVPLVPDVPADGAVLAALLHDGVEEGEPEEQLLPRPHLLVRLGVLLRLVVKVQKLALRHVLVGALDVGAQALRRLVGQLDPGLQHARREHLAGHAAQPEPEVVVELDGLVGLEQLL